MMPTENNRHLFFSPPASDAGGEPDRALRRDRAIEDDPADTADRADHRRNPRIGRRLAFGVVDLEAAAHELRVPAEVGLLVDIGILDRGIRHAIE